MLGGHVADNVVCGHHIAVPSRDQDNCWPGAQGEYLFGWDIIGEKIVRDEVVVSQRVNDAVKVIEAIGAVDEWRKSFRATPDVVGGNQVLFAVRHA